MSLNANSPTIVGLEWMPLRQRGLAIDVNRRQAARFTPGAVTGDDIAVYLRNVIGSPVITAEIIRVADITTQTITTATYRPSADQGMTGAQHAGGGAVAPFFVDIDEAVLDTSDYIRAGSLSGSNSWGWNVASGGFAAGNRVLNVTLHLVMQTMTGHTLPNTVVVPWLFQGSKLNLAAQTVTTTQQQFDLAMATNPATGAPWQVAEVQALATTAYVGIDFGNPDIDGFRLYQAWITVDYITENRLATGTATPTAEGWLTIPMATPAGVSTWTPTAAVAYALILSTSTVGGLCVWAAPDAGVAHPDYSSAPVTVTNGFPAALGATDNAAPALVVINATPQYGQPYALVLEEAVYTGRVLQQEVTLPGTQSRGWLRFVARCQSAATTASLIARLKRRSDNVQIGGDVTITPFDVRGEPRLMQMISMAAASGAAGTAAQHYIEWTCTGVSGAGWLITTLSTENATYAALSIGGTTDIATIAGVDVNTRDIAVLVGTTRASPNGLTVVAA